MGQSILSKAEEAAGSYNEEKDSNRAQEDAEFGRDKAPERIFEKGQSRRIWGELYKVLDSSDVVIHVLDARDPLGTRCARIVESMKTPQYAGKHLVYLLNKCDLVPPWYGRGDARGARLMRAG